MYIQSSDVAMSSYRKFEQKTSYLSSVNTWSNGQTRNRTLNFTDYSSEENGNSENETMTKETLEENPIESFNRSKHVTNLSISTEQTLHKIIFDMTYNYILMIMFGGKRFDKDSFINNIIVEKNKLHNSYGSSYEGSYGGSFSEEYYHKEAEESSFYTTGVVKTSDGREINFDITVNMSRDFEKYYSNNINWGDANKAALCDPLVINLNTPYAEVTDQEFYFDIDADGVLDKISRLASNSGFLALDKNGDGIINDGSELFGTASGDGFSDLASYDTDHNGWIDEADAIFGALKIWSKNAQGKDILVPISAAGIGAIYLGNTDTDFSLNSSSDNTVNARIRKTGIFIYENGNIGTIQHLDMAKHEY